MRIAVVEITNILGCKYIKFAPGTLTTFSGRNGTGKTSVIDALRRVFDGGSDPGLLRRGAKLGEVVLTLDDGLKIRMRVTSKSTSYDIENVDGSIVPAPRKFIEELIDSLSVSPERILLAKPKELATILLEVMPITFGQEELQLATGEDCWPIARDMSLDEVDNLRKMIYEARRGSNKEAADKAAAIRSLSTSLPPGDSTIDWKERVTELRGLLDEAKQGRESKVKLIERTEREHIAELKNALEFEIARLRAALGEEVEAVQSQEKDAIRSIDEESAPELEHLSKTIGEAEANLQAHDRAEGIRKSIATFQHSKDEAERCATGFDLAIQSIDELKQQKLSGLPISGLEVREGQAFLDGIAFEHVNLRKRIEIAFQICALRSNGKLNFMLLDEAEAFDSDSWAEFREGAVGSGFQIVAARVSDGDLAIEIENAA